MTNKGMSKELVSADKERALRYKLFASAFSFPDKDFFTVFKDAFLSEEKMRRDYDQLFRKKEIWLYTAEYTCQTEFQRANCLADISGFYKAFGLEPDKDRPDALVTELEFIHYLIFKELNAPDREKALICFSARKKFFVEHLLPSAKKIAQAIISQSKNNFYREIAQEMLTFLESEEKILTGDKQ